MSSMKDTSDIRGAGHRALLEVPRALAHGVRSAFGVLGGLTIVVVSIARLRERNGDV